jgi:hypothetical protein
MAPKPTLRPNAKTLESETLESTKLSKAQQLPSNIGQVAQLLINSENTKNVLGSLEALESICKPLDKAVEITAIYNSFNTKSSESKKKPADKLLNIMLGRLVVTYNDPLLSKAIGLNLNQFNKLFNTNIFSSHVPTLNKYLENYDVESFEYALASRLFSIRDKIQTKLNQQRQASESASKKTELTKLEARSQALDERRASIQKKKKTEPTISPRQPNLAELDVISTTGPDQYLGDGMVHSGIPRILNEKASRLIIPTHFQPWLIKQISSCIVNEYGLNIDNNALDVSGSEYEEGIAQFANNRLVTGSKNRGATYTTAIVQMPNWSTADTQTKADLVAISYNRPLTEEEIKLQEVFYSLAEKIYTLSEEKLLVSYHDETPSKFGDIKTYIESLQLKNESEILQLLSDYQAQIKILISAIRIISKDYLVNTTSPSIEDININLNNLKGTRIITTSINEISNTLRNLEYELLDTRGLKPDLYGLQVKTSQKGAESHMDKNGQESTPVVIGNSPQAIQVIQATAKDPKAETRKALACSKYLKALEFMCDELLT